MKLLGIFNMFSKELDNEADMAKENGLEFFAVNDRHSRRQFLKKSTGLLSLAVLPLAACGNAFDKNKDKDSITGYKISFEITFSEPMDIASFESGLSISPAPVQPGSFTWSGGDTVVYYIADAENGTTYTVTIPGSVTDKAGNPLDGNGNGTGGDAYPDFQVPAAAA